LIIDTFSLPYGAYNSAPGVINIYFGVSFFFDALYFPFLFSVFIQDFILPGTVVLDGPMAQLERHSIF